MLWQIKVNTYNDKKIMLTFFLIYISRQASDIFVRLSLPRRVLILYTQGIEDPHLASLIPEPKSKSPARLRVKAIRNVLTINCNLYFYKNIVGTAAYIWSFPILCTKSLYHAMGRVLSYCSIVECIHFLISVSRLKNHISNLRL